MSQGPPQVTGYTWVREIGAGGFADVHLYRQSAPARDVAVKVLRAVGDVAGRRALAAEADALAGVAGHPAVVSLYSTGTTVDGRPYLAMEYCPVTNLSEQVRRQPLALARALDLMVQIASAVETLHRRGLVHRDVKPANLMLTRWQRPVLADFGAALPVGAAPSAAGGFSLLWAPPEQQSGASAHPTQDVWALGATTWTLLAGTSPFEERGGDNSPSAVALRVQAGRLPGLSRPDVPPQLVAVLRAALSVDVGARTSSALEFAEQLRSVQDLIRLTPTPLIVRDVEPGAEPQAIDENRTRVRGFPIVDAQPAGHGFEFSAPEAAADLDLTLPPQPAPDPAPVPPRPPDRGGLRPWLVAVMVAVAVLLTGGVVAATVSGGGLSRPRTTASAAPIPQDPVGAPLPAVAGLAGEVHGDRIYWTWQAVPTEKVRYVVTITRPGRDVVTRDVRTPAVDIASVPGENCIEVVAASTDGRGSAPVTDCVPVP